MLQWVHLSVNFGGLAKERSACLVEGRAANQSDRRKIAVNPPNHSNTTPKPLSNASVGLARERGDCLVEFGRLWRLKRGNTGNLR